MHRPAQRSIHACRPSLLPHACHCNTAAMPLPPHPYTPHPPELEQLQGAYLPLALVVAARQQPPRQHALVLVHKQLLGAIDAYQQLHDVRTSGATRSTYKLTAAQRGKYVAVLVTGTSLRTTATIWLSKTTTKIR